MVTKMEKAAKEMGVEALISAYPEAELEKHLDEADVVLLGPQIRYALKRSKQLCDPRKIPVAVINSIDYGMMDGKKVLEEALSMIEKQNGSDCK